MKVGKQKNRPAYLYIGMDLGRLSDEMHKLLKRARKDNLPIEKVHAELENQGLFSLVSGYKYETEEILPEYYLRQGIEQLNDVVQNYTKLLPVRCHTKESFVGHVNLSMIGSTIVRFIQIQMNEDEMYLGSRFEALRCQKCILYNTKLVPDVPMKLANDLYRVFKMTSPTSIPISDGRLMSERPKSVSHFFKVPKKRIVKNGRMGKDAHVETDADSTENGEAGEQQGQNEATSK